jgi:hypothetical protein
MDEILAAWMNRVIDNARRRHQQRAARIPEPTEKPKLLFAGYNGTRNTGSDIRVEEMLRQVRHLFGAGRRRRRLPETDRIAGQHHSANRN